MDSEIIFWIFALAALFLSHFTLDQNLSPK
jgi:hypothetical protein